MKKVLLVDLSAIFWANWHASANEELSAAFEKTAGKVVSLASGYDHVAVCGDAPPYNRKLLAPSYKANRAAAPPMALAQLAKVKERLAADGFCMFDCKGLEADDVIATVVELAKREEGPLDITIASGDKDLLALVSDSGFVRAISTNDGHVYDEAGVVARLGVPAKLVPDWLALVGDKGDNVSGVKGIGPKLATKLLAAFGTLDGILEQPVAEIVAVVGKVGEAFSDDATRKGVALAMDLIRLETNAPIDFDAIFVKREPKPLGPKGAWDEAEFDEVLPPVHEKTPAQTADDPPADDALTSRVAPSGGDSGHLETALALPPKIQTIAIRPAEWSNALEPATGREAWIVAKYLNDSRLYPNLGSREAIFTVILRGRSLGLDAATACAMFHVVEGRPVMHAELICGLVVRSGKAQYFRCLETDDDHAVYATKRIGDDHEVKLRWDMDRALRAGLVTKTPGGYRGVSRSGRATNWDKYQRTMLRWRAGTELAHAVYPEIVSGLVTPDEAEHIEAAE